MALPSEKLAQSLAVLRLVQETKKSPVIKSSDITRTHLERLTDNGFLMKSSTDGISSQTQAHVLETLQPGTFPTGNSLTNMSVKNSATTGAFRRKSHWTSRQATGRFCPN